MEENKVYSNIINSANLDELLYCAREVLYNIRYDFPFLDLDEEGNYIISSRTEEERAKLYQQYHESRLINPETKYLFWDECVELYALSIGDALELFTADIKDKYLDKTLPIARNIMRDDLTDWGKVADDMSDDYLDHIICMAWKTELLIRVVGWHKKNWEKEDEQKG